jgi:hypothetical protein
VSSNARATTHLCPTRRVWLSKIDWRQPERQPSLRLSSWLQVVEAAAIWRTMVWGPTRRRPDRQVRPHIVIGHDPTLTVHTTAPEPQDMHHNHRTASNCEVYLTHSGLRPVSRCCCRYQCRPSSRRAASSDKRERCSRRSTCTMACAGWVRLDPWSPTATSLHQDPCRDVQQLHDCMQHLQDCQASAGLHVSRKASCVSCRPPAEQRRVSGANAGCDRGGDARQYRWQASVAGSCRLAAWLRRSSGRRHEQSRGR